MDSILFPHILLIYSIDTILYPYALPIITSLDSLISRSRKLDLVYFIFSFHFYFIFDLFFHFLFLEQLGLGLIGHTVTTVT